MTSIRYFREPAPTSKLCHLGISRLAQATLSPSSPRYYYRLLHTYHIACCRSSFGLLLSTASRPLSRSKTLSGPVLSPSSFVSFPPLIILYFFSMWRINYESASALSDSSILLYPWRFPPSLLLSSIVMYIRRFTLGNTITFLQSYLFI